MRKKRLVSLSLIGVTIALLVGGCTKSEKSDSSSSKNDSKDMIKVETAFNNLKKLDGVYEISNVMQSPEGSLCYVEICNKGASYTEYSVDKDGNYGTVAFQNSSNTDFILSDWVTKENKGYTTSSDNKWLVYPDTYAKELSSRKYMYFDKIKDKLTDLKFKESTTVDIGMGDEDIDVYTATLDSATVRDIMGIGSEKLYTSVKNDSQDENIQKFCGYCNDDIGFTMVFSDAKVRIGVIDDTLRYLQLEVGGIGTRLYYTKAVLTRDIDVREEPDFSSAEKYETSLKEMADYVAKYDSYEEAMYELDKAKKEEAEKASADTTEKPAEEE